MDRTDVCILINSTPKYYYILPFMIGMLRRYAPDLAWPIYVATEEPHNSIITSLDVKLITLEESKSGFLESRRSALGELLGQYKYCLPLQDDFILEQGMDGVALKAILRAMDDDDDVVSARLMPCPGPKGSRAYIPGWNYLKEATDTYGFTFQATLWKTYACYQWYSDICSVLYKKIGLLGQDASVEVRHNLAENSEGQQVFWMVSRAYEYKHVAWVRKGNWPNAVYLSPFPYRPTAIVRGKLEGWAKDLMGREGFA
jgi:hypothetical protein